MAGIEKKKDAEISGLNRSYYDEIAADYEVILNQDSANAVIREKIANKFTGLVKTGRVLDFGGGTGMDMGWMLQQHYQVIFCEPAEAMRQVAIARVQHEFNNAGISFLPGNATDFRQWSPMFPLDKPVDAALANFAVLNCIPDITLLFEKLALVIKPGGVLIALILDNSLAKRWRSNFKGTLQSFFSNAPVSFYIDYHDRRQFVYIHSTRAIKKSLANYFTLTHVEPLHGLGFCLVHAVRK
jgi:SAM-dependent methyltransferase